MTEAHADAIRRDLNLVLEGSRWAWGLMWENPGRGLDAERGTVHRAPTPEELYARQTNPDAVDGPTHDFGTGNHRARVAYRAAARAVNTCAVYLEAAARADGFEPSRPCPETGDTPPPLTLAAVAAHAHACLSVIRPEKHTRRLAHLRKLLDSAVRGLSPVLDQGKAEDIAHREDAQPETGFTKKDRCRVCDYYKALPKSGGRCSKCRAFFRKYGKENIGLITPRRAQQKRMERNEGYGAA